MPQDPRTAPLTAFKKQTQGLCFPGGDSEAGPPPKAHRDEQCWGLSIASPTN